MAFGSLHNFTNCLIARSGHYTFDVVSGKWFHAFAAHNVPSPSQPSKQWASEPWQVLNLNCMASLVWLVVAYEPLCG